MCAIDGRHDVDKRLRLLLISLLVPLLLAICKPAFAESNKSSSNAPGEFTSLQELDGKHIGVQTGTTFDKITQKSLPNAKIDYYNAYADLAEALSSKKVDGFPGDEPVIRLLIAEHDGFTMLDESMENFEYGVVFPKTAKGDQLKGQFDSWLKDFKASGELKKLTTKWTDGPEEKKTVPDYQSLPSPNGTLTMVTEGAYPPMTYVRDGKVVGMETELTALFCKDRGYGLNINLINFDGILPAVQAGKADLALSGITITDERKESVNFSDPYYEGGTVMAVRKASQTGAAGSESTSTSFLGGFAESFSKTFLREDRWKLFLEGVGTTLLITLLSILLGTALGFLVFLLCRNGGRVANDISFFCMWLLQGMPMVVLLMILYYIVFGSLSISGVVVSIVGFTLTFGTSVFGMLKMGVGAVDDGQREAAFAMGYSDRQTFFKIILPQALPHVMEAYKSSIIDLIKGTSIVGYIAVQDLTKMGDLVRSRTYEAFFPLIAVTVIYFLLEGLVGFLAGRVELLINPKRRTRDHILKGVKTDD